MRKTIILNIILLPLFHLASLSAQTLNEPKIDSVSVVHNSTGGVYIGWSNLNPTAPIDDYTVLVPSSNGWVSIGNTTDTFYHDISSQRDPLSSSQEYMIQVNCYSCTPQSTPSEPCNTIFLTNPAHDPCSNKINLSWNEYKNMNKNLGGYYIMMQMNNGVYTIQDSTIAGQELISISTNFVNGATYSFFIKAFNSDKSIYSSSNIKSVTTTTTVTPTLLDITDINIENNSHVKMNFKNDMNSCIEQFVIYRSESKNGVYAAIEPIQNNIIANISFEDNTALFNEKSYYYYVEGQRNGNALIKSDTLRTICLTGINNETYNNSLSWNDYEGDSVLAYNIYQRVGDNAYFNIQSLTPTTNSFIARAPAINKNDSIYYYIEAELYSSTGSMFSKSNETTFTLASSIFIPNAFTPDGNNPIFIPKFVSVGDDGYRMIIYNRWGSIIFESNNTDIGWDGGKASGENTPSGVYIYYIQYKNNKGETKKRKGTVSLIK